MFIILLLINLNKFNFSLIILSESATLQLFLQMLKFKTGKLYLIFKQSLKYNN